MNKISGSIIMVLVSSALYAQIPDKVKVGVGAEKAFEKVVKTVRSPAPGCAVGVSLSGETVFERSFGLAEMEHNIPNSPQTIFESGSVGKQFTAAAIVLLEQEGKLKLDDPVRKFIPELPDYGSPLTIRHILTHTAGLRDWGSVMQLSGAGRGERVVSQGLAIDVITSQKALDFAPGTEFSYSNSGFNLAAIIVERVSKQSFADFTSERFFKPLGMTKSSWRDDYQRVVSGRAQGYSRQGNGPWRLNMPFMNVYGNGGMLTTVGDLLKWNTMLDSRSLGAPLVEALEKVGVLNDGRKINYALGLVVGEYKGLKDVSHGGATAGYQTFLARYPDQRLSIAVLCNGTSPDAGGVAADVTDEIFGPGPRPPAQPVGMETSPPTLQQYAGIWRDEKTHNPMRTFFENGVLRVGSTPLRILKDGTFQAGSGPVRFSFRVDKDGNRAFAERNLNGEVTRWIAETPWTPKAEDLASFSGNWFSEEAQAKFAFVVEGDKVFLRQRPSTKLLLEPVYKDNFSTPGYMVWFSRNASGIPEKMHIGGSRMRDMPFERIQK